MRKSIMILITTMNVFNWRILVFINVFFIGEVINVKSEYCAYQLTFTQQADTFKTWYYSPDVDKWFAKEEVEEC